MERNREAEAASNLRRIKDLTGRMAEISKHLMTFARKPRRELHPVLLAEVLDDTLDFLRTRLERAGAEVTVDQPDRSLRSEEHTSELQSLMRISYAVFCLKKKKSNTATLIHNYYITPQ